MIIRSLPDIRDHNVLLKPQYRTLFCYLTQNVELAIIINPLIKAYHYALFCRHDAYMQPW